MARGRVPGVKRSLRMEADFREAARSFNMDFS